MGELQTEVVQEKNSGPRKGFFYDRELGGYVPAKSKTLTGAAATNRNVTLTILIVVGIVGLLAYIFRDKLKTLWLNKTKEVLSSGG